MSDPLTSKSCVECSRLRAALERVCTVDKAATGRRDCDIWAEMLAEAADALRGPSHETRVTRDPVWPHGGHQTQAAGRAERPVIGGILSSAGLLLYCYVYEARWAGLRTTELCPRWQDLPQLDRDGWERLAAEFYTLMPRAAPKASEQCAFVRSAVRCILPKGHDGGCQHPAPAKPARQSPVYCGYPGCFRDRAPNSTLCAKHTPENGL